jgi:thiosulfate reductase cytochrome b subunit
VVSGVAILIAHPRLYWGETGSLETASLIDLPLTLTLGHSGWGRYLHFLSAWAVVLTGVTYVVSGLLTSHFRKHLLPHTASHYEPLQRWTYLVVVFALFPLIVLTGLAMSPAVTSVVPWIATMSGGHQSARTIHFLAASVLTLFVIGHVAMVVAAGFVERVVAMITGGRETAQEQI